MCILWGFCTVLMKEMVNIIVLVSYNFIVFMVDNAPLTRIIKICVFGDIIHIRLNTMRIYAVK